VFPPPVIDIADTFFSRQVPVTPETPGRRYLGICAHGVRLKSAEIRLAEILLIAGQSLFDAYGAVADPASEVRGEGIFLRIDPALMAAWETRVRDLDVVREHISSRSCGRTLGLPSRKCPLAERAEVPRSDHQHVPDSYAR
jgi:hypothetical protein